MGDLGALGRRVAGRGLGDGLGTGPEAPGGARGAGPRGARPGAGAVAALRCSSWPGSGLARTGPRRWPRPSLVTSTVSWETWRPSLMISHAWRGGGSWRRWREVRAPGRPWRPRRTRGDRPRRHRIAGGGDGSRPRGGRARERSWPPGGRGMAWRGPGARGQSTAPPRPPTGRGRPRPVPRPARGAALFTNKAKEATADAAASDKTTVSGWGRPRPAPQPAWCASPSISRGWGRPSSATESLGGGKSPRAR